MLLKATYVVGIALTLSICAIVLFTGTEVIRSDCECLSFTPAEDLEAADRVFLGKVVDRGAGYGTWECWGPELLQGVVGGGRYSAQFLVDTVWKGSVSETIYVNTRGECGADFRRDETYLVYAYGRVGVPSVSFCDVFHVSRAERTLGSPW